MIARRSSSILSQVFVLVLICVLATLALGLGVVALSPPPPPSTVSVASFIKAYSQRSSRDVDVSVSRRPPQFGLGPRSQPETIIAAALAEGLGKPVAEVRVAMGTLTLFGLRPRPNGVAEGQMTIIDVPPAASTTRAQPFSLSALLRNEAIRVPPFFALIRNADGTWSELRPKESLTTPWRLRLLIVFVLALVVVTPLAWLGARRWTRSVRRLAERVDRFDGQTIDQTVCEPTDAAEVQALERAFEALHHRIKSQVEQRTTMLMAVAHDLRTPLTSLRVRSEDAPDELRAGMLRDIVRVERMVEGVLRFAESRSPREDANAVDFHSVVRESIESARHSGGTVEAQLGDACVWGDAVELGRAVDNLIQNAVKFGETVRVTLKTNDQTVRLIITDDGPGVPSEFITRLTDPFFRVDVSRSAATGGLGLGLATANAIVSSHRGRLEFRNPPRGGFEAAMDLPAWGPHIENSDAVPV